MKDLSHRTMEVAEYLVTNNSTIRKTAQAFGIAKSTVHFDISHRLKHLDFGLYDKVRCILKINFEEKNVRGGIATKDKYAQKKKAQKASKM